MDNGIDNENENDIVFDNETNTRLKFLMCNQIDQEYA
jgi:hypothetical protein